MEKSIHTGVAINEIRLFYQCIVPKYRSSSTKSKELRRLIVVLNFLTICIVLVSSLKDNVSVKIFIASCRKISNIIKSMLVKK